MVKRLVASTLSGSLALALAPVACAAVCATGCATSTPRFAPKAPTWIDPDTTPFARKPAKYDSPLIWDAADKQIFLPIDAALAVDVGFEAVNVNAVDEVPDSSWFQNRLGRAPLGRDDFRDGPCRGSEPLRAEPPWRVIDAKPDGANPGFMIETRGQRWLVKLEDSQLERASSADVIGSRIYWAAGFDTPCNEVVYMRPSILEIDPAATVKEAGAKVALSQRHLDAVFHRAKATDEGTYRASASRVFGGEPLGPWTYRGVRDDDPNDVVPHEDRRELRGSRLLAAWLNHHDAREQNTLALWMKGEDGKGWVRHAILDWGDCLGGLWDWDALSRRTGFAYYLDPEYVALDFLTLGVPRRPWDRARLGPAGEVLGYFDVELFDPEAWRPGYPNPAFSRMTERDAAWMARIIARFDDQAVDALVDAAQVKTKIVDRELRRILRGRRDKIVRRFLARLSPLTAPEVRADPWPRVCVEDLLVTAKLARPEERRYVVRAWVGDDLREVDVGAPTTPGPPWVCARLPAVEGASDTSPRYVIVDLIGVSPGFERRAPTRVHLYQFGPARYRVVGLERPSTADAPRG